MADLKPITRKEKYLAKISGDNVKIPEKPITREEMYLDAIAKNSAGGSGDDTYTKAEIDGMIEGVSGDVEQNSAEIAGIKEDYLKVADVPQTMQDYGITDRQDYPTTKATVESLSPLITAPENYNNIYRGKDITEYYTMDELAEKVDRKDFSGLYLGDYFTIKNLTTVLPDPDGETDEPTIEVTEDVDLMIAGFNYYYNTGDTALTKNHLVLIPRGAGFKTNAKMNKAKTTDDGYLGSYMHKTVLPCYAASLKTALKNHLLSHRELLTNKVTTTAASAAGAGFVGSASGWEWATVELCLINEVQVYGTTVFSSSGYDVGNACRQLPVFRFVNPVQFGRNNFWLRCVVSSAYFAFCDYGGSANFGGASSAIFVRPLILFGTPTATAADTPMEQPQLDEMEEETSDISE